jgi:hypothetical protein
MNPLHRQAIAQGVSGLVFFIALIFLTAGTWNYWQGWVFLAVFAASTTAFTIYLAIYDKPLLERRMKAGPWHEQERSQQVIVSLVFVAFFAFIILPILDYRHGLSRVPAWVSRRQRDHRVVVPRHLPRHQGEQLGGIEYPRGGIRESSIPVRTRTCDIRCMPRPSGCLSGFRRTRLVVVGRADSVPSSPLVAPPGRGEYPRAESFRVHGVHESSEIPSHSPRVVTVTHCNDPNGALA